MTERTFTWQVPTDHPAFAGHFPGRPIVPGVLLLDQALLFAASLAAPAPGRWQVGQAKFLAPVGPGTRLDFLLRPGARGGWVFAVRHGSLEVASGSLTPTPAAAGHP